MILSSIACLGRRTITGLMCTSGNQFGDWTAFYRLFSQRRIDQDAIFGAVRSELLTHLKDGQPLVAAIDDTIARKTGVRIPGVSYRRDPLGPPFQTNLVRAQRFLQISAALPAGAATRMIPVDFQHAPTPQKPRKDAPPEQHARYRELAQQANLSRVAARRLHVLREEIDKTDSSRHLVIIGDGGYTNRNVLRDLPPNTTFIGRIRSDAKLYLPSDPTRNAGPGRNRRYGDIAPTPEQLRIDDTRPWQEVSAIISGTDHTLRVKSLSPVLWKTAGYETPLRLIVVAPTPYRLRKGSKLLYRQPAHLITTDLETPIDEIIQRYIWRTDIEVNFRDEKQGFGLGQAQVRNQQSVQAAPALAVAAYSMLLLSAARAYGAAGKPATLPPPKWMQGREKPRASTNDLRQAVRHELWARGIGNFSGFAYQPPHDAKPSKFLLPMESAALYAN